MKFLDKHQLIDHDLHIAAGIPGQMKGSEIVAALTNCEHDFAQSHIN